MKKYAERILKALLFPPLAVVATLLTPAWWVTGLPIAYVLLGMEELMDDQDGDYIFFPAFFLIHAFEKNWFGGDK